MNKDCDDLLILLHIAYGTGFDLKTGNIVLVATLSGNSLETKPVQSSTEIQFDSNLIWETNKKFVKRIKTENLPIKVKCFLSNICNGHEVRSLIGYIIIPVKGIPVILSEKNAVSKPHWNKLIGLNSKWKTKSPAVSLYLSIIAKTFQNPSNLYEQRYQNRPKILPVVCFETSAMLSSQKGLHIELLKEDGLLQVGDTKKDCDIFIFKLIFNKLKNFEHLVNQEENMHQHFKFNYNLLGTPAYRVLVPKGNNAFDIQEQISVRFRTSVQSLKEYFSNIFYIPIEIFHNDSAVGSALFNLKNVLQVSNLKDFLNEYSSNNYTLTHKNIFSVETVFELPSPALKPYIEFNFSLKYAFSKKLCKFDIEINKLQKAQCLESYFVDDKILHEQYVSSELTPKGKTNEILLIADMSTKLGNYKTTELRNCENAVNKLQEAECINSNFTGDKKLCEEYVSPELLPDSDANKILLANNLKLGKNFNDANDCPRIGNHNKSTGSKFEITTPKKIQTLDKTNFNILTKEKFMTKTTKNVPRTFSFNLILQTMKFSQRPDTGLWQISLHHQNAETIYTVTNIELIEIYSNFVEFKNLVLQLFFASTVDKIFDIISSQSFILKINGPRGFVAFAELDNEILFDSEEKRSGVILMENQKKERCVFAHISVYIEDIGISFNRKIQKHSNINNAQSSKSAQLDENLAYHMIKELENWKQKQQEIFLIELKRKEVNHLEILSIEWQKRKIKFENKFVNKLEECAQLNVTLEKAYMALKDKGLNYFEREKLIEKAQKNAENKFSKIITELNENLRKAVDDLEHKIKLEQLNCKELELENINLEKEKFILKNNLDKLHISYDEMKQNCVPKEHLIQLFKDMNALQERLQGIQKSQQFYKGQWAKIIRQLHKMKIENLQNIELQNLVQNEKDEFYSERDQLNEIKAVLQNSFDDDCKLCYEFSR